MDATDVDNAGEASMDDGNVIWTDLDDNRIFPHFRSVCDCIALASYHRLAC
jgi:hypothetical protein